MSYSPFCLVDVRNVIMDDGLPSNKSNCSESWHWPLTERKERPLGYVSRLAFANGGNES